MAKAHGSPGSSGTNSNHKSESPKHVRTWTMPSVPFLLHSISTVCFPVSTFQTAPSLAFPVSYLTTTLLLVTQAETQNHPLLSSLARSCPTSKYPESCVSYPPTMSQTHPPSSPTTTALGHICSFSYTEQSDYLLTGLLAFNIVSLQLCLQRADLTPSLCRLKLPRPGLQDNTLCTPAA